MTVLSGGGPTDPTDRTGYDHLVAEIARADILRDNPFRVTGLPTDSSARELRSAGRRLEILRRLDDGADPEAPGASDHTDGGRIDAALQRLRDPQRRLLDELLWFWSDEAEPVPDLDDPAALDAAAARLARRQGDGVAVHNLAVLELLRFAEGDETEWPKRCGPAIDAMASALQNRAIATHLTNRVVNLADPRLSVDDVGRLQEAAKLLVPLLAVRLVVDLNDRGQHEQGRVLAKVVRAHTRDDVAIDVFHRGFEPAVARVRTLAAAAGRSTDADVSNGMSEALRLLDGAGDDLRMISVLLPQSDPVRAGLVDDVAQRVIICAIRYYNETGDDAGTQRVLEGASSLRPGRAAMSRIEETRSVLNDNAAAARLRSIVTTCWFCQSASSDADVAYEIPMYGEVQRDYSYGYGYGRVTWKTVEVPVPRCPTCARSHGTARRPRSAGWLWGAAGVVPPLLTAAFGQPAPVLWVTWLLLAGLLLGWEWRGRSVVGREVDWRAREFPLVRDRVGSGWAYGTRPPGVN